MYEQDDFYVTAEELKAFKEQENSNSNMEVDTLGLGLANKFYGRKWRELEEEERENYNNRAKETPRRKLTKQEERSLDMKRLGNYVSINRLVIVKNFDISGTYCTLTKIRVKMAQYIL